MQHRKPQDERFDLHILSEAGKPIYSFTKRDDAVTLVPLFSALINYAKKTQKEMLQCIKTSDNLVINFATRPPLIIIVIHEKHSYVEPQVLIEQVEAQIISILTAKTLKSVFDERPTFDLKRLLYGSEKLIDSTINLSAFATVLHWPWMQSFLAVKIPTSNSPIQQSNNLLPTTSPIKLHRVLIPLVSMPPNTRDNIQSLINNVINTNSKSIIFSLLFRLEADTADTYEDSNDGSANGDVPEYIDQTEKSDRFRLILVCNHHDRHKLKMADIHIILALLVGSKAQLDSAESLWLPICLPKFNQDAFLHTYVSFINQSRNCLVLMSIDRDEFSNCQKSRNLIEDKLASLLSDKSQRSKMYYQTSPLVHPVLLELQEKLLDDSLSEDELAEVKQQAQIYNSKFELYHTRQLQFLWYQTSNQVLWWQRSAKKSLNPVIYYVTKKMLQSSLKHLWLKLADDTIFLGWHVPTFQLYAQFDHTITTNEATEVVQRITNWIKKEEDNFSFKDYK